MKKLLIILMLLTFFPYNVLAQEIANEQNVSIVNVEMEAEQAPIVEQEVFQAQVLEVMDQRDLTRSDGSVVIQQNLKLKGLDGNWAGKEFEYFGISELDVVGGNVYKKDDKVLALYSPDTDGNDIFFITDYVRQGYLVWLVAFFVLLIVFVASWKGIKALLSLVLTFFVILWFIIPRILIGDSPLLITIIGSVFIIFIIVYLTEGWNRKSHLAVASIVISLLLTGLLAIFFTNMARLTGSSDEEAMFLIGLGKGIINFRGLLLAGIMIGTLGALDDGVISQIAAVDEIKKANSSLSNYEVFKRSMKIGVSHIGSMTNTLFLAYAGASMPLLLILSVRQDPFVSFSQIINNEMIATEIVRAFVGSIGLAMAVPIATILAAYFIKVKK